MINKWDLVEKETNTARDYEKVIKDRIAPFTDVPVIFISVLDKTRIFRAVEAALDDRVAAHRGVPELEVAAIHDEAAGNDGVEAAAARQALGVQRMARRRAIVRRRVHVRHRLLFR